MGDIIKGCASRRCRHEADSEQGAGGRPEKTAAPRPSPKYQRKKKPRENGGLGITGRESLGDFGGVAGVERWGERGRGWWG